MKLLSILINLLYLSIISYAADNSILTEGKWYKIAITSNGIHKIDYNFLKSAGINVDQINPQKIKLYGNGGYMLPQSNNEPRPTDLIENSIFVEGEADMKFDDTDYILFYACSPHKVDYNLNEKVFAYEHNLYTDTTYYFLTIASEDGLRIGLNENAGDDFSEINTFNDYKTHKIEKINILKSGRKWYGEKFDSNTPSQIFTFNFPGLVSSAPCQITSNVMGQNEVNSSFKLYVNDNLIGSQNIPPIKPYVIDPYGIKGYENLKNFILPNILPTDDQEIKVELNYSNNKGYLDYIIVSVSRQLKQYNNQTIFRSILSLENDFSTFKVEETSTGSIIWEITNPLNPLRQEATFSNGTLSFGTNTNSLKEYVVFSGNDFPSPIDIKEINNQNLRGNDGANLVIVTIPNLLIEAQRLAQFRSSINNISVKVVTTQQVYNEFASGIPDPTAIRDYMYFLYNEKNNLDYLLLFGDCTYDYKGINTNYKDFVPTYQSRNSLTPLESFASDDYFGMLDENEGYWDEAPNNIDDLEIAIGRFPINTLEEAKAVVDKLIYYYSCAYTYGDWRNKITFVADDGDNNIHQKDADNLSQKVENNYLAAHIEKVYTDAYTQEKNANSERAPLVKKAIENSVKQGSLVLNYTGHGNENLWADEHILELEDISTWENINNLPFFVTATCEFGRYDDPIRKSGGEMLITTHNGGAIGMVTSTRIVKSNTNFQINNAFYDHVFEKVNGSYQTIGEIFRKTKNQSINGVSNRNFSLLADPSMVLAYPTKQVLLTKVNNMPINDPHDTLKALSKITLSGEIVDPASQTKINEFNGEIIVNVFDKPVSMTTLGSAAPPMIYEKQNIIFRGQASVIEGTFSITFIVPKNINYQVDNGKVSFYAMNNDATMDAGGGNNEIKVGKTYENYTEDTTPPTIKLFMDDESFESGGITAPNTLLIAKIYDESGINISYTTDTNHIVATLDEEEEYILNDFYKAIIDTYKEGSLAFPFYDLSEGRHSINLKVWDIYNNSNTASIDFIVASNEKVAIQKAWNYPNPFSKNTTFYIEHNRAGENLEVFIDIFSMNGEKVKQIKANISDTPTSLKLIDWDGTNYSGSPLPGGTYLFNITAKSLDTGLVNNIYNKLVIIR